MYVSDHVLPLPLVCPWSFAAPLSAADHRLHAPLETQHPSLCLDLLLCVDRPFSVSTLLVQYQLKWCSTWS